MSNKKIITIEKVTLCIPYEDFKKFILETYGEVLPSLNYPNWIHVNGAENVINVSWERVTP